MRRNLLYPALAFALAVLVYTVTPAVSQISHRPPGQPAQLSIDACTFLTQQTAASLYGAPVSAGVSQDAGAAGMFLCLFADPKKSDAVSLLIQQVPAGVEGTLMDAMIKGSAGSHSTPVPGLGERAAYTSDGTALELVVLNHGKLVMLGINGADTPSRRAALLPVVREIVGKV